MPRPSAPRILRFGIFEFDADTGDLWQAGHRVRLQEQPRQVLGMLLARPGELVTREEVRAALWPADTFVDFDAGLNVVVNRIRHVLHDSASSPRYIETLPRRGYRFVAPVESVPPHNFETIPRRGYPFNAPVEAVVDPADVLVHSADSPRFVQTVPRRGYRFIAPVEGESKTLVAEPGAPPVVTQSLPGTSANAPQERVGRSTLIAVTALLVMVATVASIGLYRRATAFNSPPTRVMPLTRLAGTASWPAFAPDGDQVAFGWSGEKFGNTDIYVTLVGSTNVRRVTADPADDLAPSWSPDGRRIAFLRRVGHSARIHVTSALGGLDSKLSDFPVAVIEAGGLIGAQIAWSPDGKSIVAGRDPRDSTSVSAGLYRIAADGGEPHALTRPRRSGFDFAPAFSPDGHRLAYLSCERMGELLPLLLPDLCAVRVIDVDDRATPTSDARTLATKATDPAGIAWSRDGESIVFVSHDSHAVRLWRLWVNGTRPPERLEIVSESAEFPAATPSRDRLVFSKFVEDAHLYRFNAELPAEQVAASSSVETDPSFSPDGQRLAFASGRSGNMAIWVSAADGSSARQLTHSKQGAGSPAWSPDGRSIAFDSGDVANESHIWTVDAEGGTYRQITTGPGSQTVPRWSRDGRWIYFSRSQDNARDIWRVRAIGGELQRVTRTGSGSVGYELEDGAKLLYQAANRDSALLLLAPTGTTPRQLVDCARAGAFVPAGRTVIYVACDPSLRPPLRMIDLDTGRDRLLGRLEHFHQGTFPSGNLAASPDGRTIIFRGTVRRGSDLMLIENFR